MVAIATNVDSAVSAASRPSVPPAPRTPSSTALILPVALAAARAAYVDLDPRIEYFVILTLDATGVISGHRKVATGTRGNCWVSTRAVFCAALQSHAAAIILVHNHPSGDAQPSRADVELTARMRELGNQVGIKVLAHLVLGAGSHALVRT